MMVVAMSPLSRNLRPALHLAASFMVVKLFYSRVQFQSDVSEVPVEQAA